MHALAYSVKLWTEHNISAIPRLYTNTLCHMCGKQHFISRSVVGSSDSVLKNDVVIALSQHCTIWHNMCIVCMCVYNMFLFLRPLWCARWTYACCFEHVYKHCIPNVLYNVTIKASKAIYGVNRCYGVWIVHDRSHTVQQTTASSGSRHFDAHSHAVLSLSLSLSFYMNV